jgi:uncharacterized protein YozE (UPF0346 family)
MASLPPHLFLSQIYTANQDIKIVYKLNCIVCFTGAHYFVLVRAKVPGNQNRVWTLYNDDDPPKRFQDFADVSRYLMQSNVVPTMVIFEGQPYRDVTID